MAVIDVNVKWWHWVFCWLIFFEHRRLWFSSFHFVFPSVEEKKTMDRDPKRMRLGRIRFVLVFYFDFSYICFFSSSLSARFDRRRCVGRRSFPPARTEDKSFKGLITWRRLGWFIRPALNRRKETRTDGWDEKKQENRKVKRKTKRKERALELFAWKGYRILGPLRSWSGPWLVREDGATNQELATYRYHFFSLHRPLRTHARPQRESGGSWLATGCVSSTNPVPARNGPWFLIRSLHGKALSRHWLSRRNGNYGRKLALSLAIRTHIFVASILFFVHRQWNVLTANYGIVAHFRRSP